jgi:hypothetical protein
MWDIDERKEEISGLSDDSVRKRVSKILADTSG